MTLNFAGKLILTYIVSFLVLCTLFGLFNDTPYDMTTLTWWLRKPLGLLAFVPVGYLIERRIKKNVSSRSH